MKISNGESETANSKKDRKYNSQTKTGQNDNHLQNITPKNKELDTRRKR